eukprot:GHVS01057017.1.p1 GENE.GHVS01057017.1~~GHVS01057017.1.p1  ORF type:complete len:284 (+),score=45.29 GHVS01057017.1:473-1324(+)
MARRSTAVVFLLVPIAALLLLALPAYAAKPGRDGDTGVPARKLPSTEDSSPTDIPSWHRRLADLTVGKLKLEGKLKELFLERLLQSGSANTSEEQLSLTLSNRYGKKQSVNLVTTLNNNEAEITATFFKSDQTKARYDNLLIPLCFCSGEKVEEQFVVASSYQTQNIVAVSLELCRASKPPSETESGVSAESAPDTTPETCGSTVSAATTNNRDRTRCVMMDLFLDRGLDFGVWRCTDDPPEEREAKAKEREAKAEEREAKAKRKRQRDWRLRNGTGNIYGGK